MEKRLSIEGKNLLKLYYPIQQIDAFWLSPQVGWSLDQLTCVFPFRFVLDTAWSSCRRLRELEKQNRPRQKIREGHQISRCRINRRLGTLDCRANCLGNSWQRKTRTHLVWTRIHWRRSGHACTHYSMHFPSLHYGTDAKLAEDHQWSQTYPIGTGISHSSPPRTGISQRGSEIDHSPLASHVRASESEHEVAYDELQGWSP